MTHRHERTEQSRRAGPARARLARRGQRRACAAAASRGRPGAADRWWRSTLAARRRRSGSGPDYVPLSPLLVLPMVLGSLFLGPAAPAVVRGLRAARASSWSMPQQTDITPRHRRRRRGDVHRLGFIILLTSFRRSPARRRRRPGRVDAGRPARPDPEPGRHPDAARRAGTPSRRCAPPAARRSPATSSSPPARRTATGSRSSSSTSPARARAPAPARCCCPGPSAACSARCRPSDFLPAANDYLLRQDWDEGFATAIHLSLDLTHRRTSRSAPPATRRPPSAIAGSGRWAVQSSEGPALGLIDGADVPRGPRAAAPGRRDHALHRRAGRDPAPRHRARHRPDARPGRAAAARASSRAGRSG